MHHVHLVRTLVVVRNLRAYPHSILVWGSSVEEPDLVLGGLAPRCPCRGLASRCSGHGLPCAHLPPCQVWWLFRFGSGLSYLERLRVRTAGSSGRRWVFSAGLALSIVNSENMFLSRPRTHYFFRNPDCSLTSIDGRYDGHRCCSHVICSGFHMEIRGDFHVNSELNIIGTLHWCSFWPRQQPIATNMGIMGDFRV